MVVNETKNNNANCRTEDIIKLSITKETLDRYFKYYFFHNPKRKKNPIEAPTHPSINRWMTMNRIQLNELKQQWKQFIIWYIEREVKMKDLRILRCDMEFVSYFKTKIRKDNDNTVPKFILDGLVDSGFIIDDDSLHLERLILRCGYDKLNPRTEIYVYVKER
jgi:hypothetical protein